MHCMQYNLHKYCIIIIVLCVLDAVKVPYCACRSQHMRTLIGNYHVTALLSTNARTCTLDLEHAGVYSYRKWYSCASHYVINLRGNFARGCTSEPHPSE